MAESGMEYNGNWLKVVVSILAMPFNRLRATKFRKSQAFFSPKFLIIFI